MRIRKFAACIGLFVLFALATHGRAAAATPPGGLSGPDCNTNFIVDSVDISSGQSQDCNTNAEPDECDTAFGASADCNSDHTPDACQIAGRDCNTNGVFDACELAGNDADTNGTPDACDLLEARTRRVPTEYATIQAAINASTNGDAVVIADGTYTGTGNKNIVFGGRRIEVRSGSNDPGACIVDCESAGRGFAFAAGDDGVTLRGIRVINCVLPFQPPYNDNLGAFNIQNCSPTLILCQALTSNAGAIYIDRGSPLIQDCELSDTINQVGVFIYNASPRLVNTTIRHNTGGNCGVEITQFNGGVSQPVFNRCRILGNGGANPGGVFLIGVSRASFYNCLFSGNNGAFGGGLSVLFGSRADVVNCTFVGNNGQFGGNIRVGTADSITIRNSILWANSQGGFQGEAGQLSIDGAGAVVDIAFTTFMNYAGTYGGAQMSASNPFLVDADGVDNVYGTIDDNVHPQNGGSAVDSGDNASAACLITDLDGDARIVYAGQPPRPALGNPTPIVDRGVYEINSFQPMTNDCNTNLFDDPCEISRGLTPDCNTNGSPDACDVAFGGSSDCNTNGTLDPCEMFADCNTNGTPDACDLQTGASDCNTNGIPDACDSAAGSADCNTDGILNVCDPDCDTNGTSDVCDVMAGAADCNTSSTPDACELPGGDCNTNATLDACELAGRDCNTNATLDACELAGRDCNTNGIPDDCDASAGSAVDCNTDGRPDVCEPDCDTNSTPDSCDVNAGAADCNTNGTPDACELAGGDCDANGTPDSCDVNAGAADCNTNGTPDACELVGGDCDTNGTADACDIGPGGIGDCNANATPDACEALPDCNTNGTPDSCELSNPTSLSAILARLSANHASVTAAVPNLYPFTDGDVGNNIYDGGDDMYDGGNYLSTDLSSEFDYTNGVIVSSDNEFGAGSRSFTAKFPGLFVLAVENMNVQAFETSGNNGADGDGFAQGHSGLPLDVGSSHYTVYAKTVAGAGDPTINHIMIVPGSGAGVVHDFSNDTDDDFDRLSGLGGVRRLYYLLLARDDDQPLDQTQIIEAARRFLDPRGSVNNDCDTNGTLDACDVAAGGVADCNTNGVPDSCDFIGQSLSQWASYVIGFSGEYDNPDYSAAQTLGAPDTFDYGDIESAWTSSSENGTLEYVTVGFATPVYATGATIRETYGNGMVYQVDVVDTNDVLHTVWTGIDPSRPGAPVDYEVTWPRTTYLVKGVKVYVDTDHDKSWEEIDAIALHASALPSVDCNTNGIPDECELAGRDCNTNTTPDVCEQDTDRDGTIDACDLCPGVADGADSDKDGVPDGCDGCPNDPAKTDPGACGCGVPDTDTDRDGVPDCFDRCPSDPNKIDVGACGCGVADVDANGDGVPDCLSIDLCPNDPNKTNPGACGCGVADIDANGDGVPDCFAIDHCPNDPAKTEPGVCGCGVADVDLNHDGVPDCLLIDLCPNDPAKTNPGVCGCGVPDADSDGDGVPDCRDNCRTVFNPEQADANTNGTGDACETAPPAGQTNPPTDPRDLVRWIINLLFGAPTCGSGMMLTLTGSIAGLMGMKRAGRRRIR